MKDLLKRYGLGLTGLMVAATAFWILMMILLPYGLMADYSFRPNLPPAEIGGPNDHYTFANYLTLFGEINFAEGTLGDDLRVFLRTIWGGTVVTFICLIVCYPIAYYLAHGTRPEKAAFIMLLLVIPFWVNEILRTFSWYIILAYQGPLNFLLQWVGILDKPVRFLSGSIGVLLGMVYAFVLFMVFPLYNAIETLDKNQIEAARDLGAGSVRIHWRIIVPHAKPGIAVGCIMVFVLAVSSYAVPAILGSPGTRWFTETIYQWFFEGQDWPQGSAYAFILLLLCIFFILVMMRIFKVGLTDIAK